MSTFSLWTVGSIGPTSCCNSQSKTQILLSRIQRKIQVSIVNTWVNAAISTIFAILYAVFCTRFSDSFLRQNPVSPPVILIIWLFGTILTLIVIDNFRKFCCYCCLTHFLPITRPTVLDVNNIDKIIYLDELANDNFSIEEMKEYDKTSEEENIPSEESNPKNMVECENDEKLEIDENPQMENFSMFNMYDDDLICQCSVYTYYLQ